MSQNRNRCSGRAHGAFVAPCQQLRAAYLALPPHARAQPLSFQGTTLAGNVAALFPDIELDKYEYLR